MKKLVIALLATLIAVPAVAGTIIDIQTGMYAEGDIVTVTGAVVIAERYNGVFISEDPNAPYAGIWVYTGAAPGVVVGDLVDVKGEYKEYYDFSEIDVAADPTGYVNFVSIHTGLMYPLNVTTGDLITNGEAYEGCFITVTDGMVVTTAPNTYGEWEVESVESPGNFLVMDDYFYDDTTVQLGDCYDCATGVLNYSYGAFKLEPFDGAICIVDCSVGNEVATFGQVKALYR